MSNLQQNQLGRDKLMSGQASNQFTQQQQQQYQQQQQQGQVVGTRVEELPPITTTIEITKTIDPRLASENLSNTGLSSNQGFSGSQQGTKGVLESTHNDQSSWSKGQSGMSNTMPLGSQGTQILSKGIPGGQGSTIPLGSQGLSSGIQGGQGSTVPLGSQGGQGFSGSTQNVQSGIPLQSNIPLLGMSGTGLSGTGSTIPLSSQGMQGVQGGQSFSGTTQNLQSGIPLQSNVPLSGVSTGGLSGTGSTIPFSSQGGQGLSGSTQGLQGNMPVGSTVRSEGLSNTGFNQKTNPSQIGSHFATEG